VVGLPAVVLLAFWYWRFVEALPAPTRRRVVAAAALYVGGALGLELIQGPLDAIEGTQTLRYAAIGIVEECCEMIGAGLFLSATLGHLRTLAPIVRIRLDEGKGEPAEASYV
jgi:hypothetical protein